MILNLRDFFSSNSWIQVSPPITYMVITGTSIYWPICLCILIQLFIYWTAPLSHPVSYNITTASITFSYLKPFMVSSDQNKFTLMFILKYIWNYVRCSIKKQPSYSVSLSLTLSANPPYQSITYSVYTLNVLSII